MTVFALAILFIASVLLWPGIQPGERCYAYKWRALTIVVGIFGALAVAGLH
jgi:hypothetical protein